MNLLKLLKDAQLNLKAAKKRKDEKEVQWLTGYIAGLEDAITELKRLL